MHVLYVKPFNKVYVFSFYLSYISVVRAMIGQISRPYSTVRPFGRSTKWEILMQHFSSSFSFCLCDLFESCKQPFYEEIRFIRFFADFDAC